MTNSILQMSCELFLAYLIRETGRGQIRWRRGAVPDSLIGLSHAGIFRLSQAEEDDAPAFHVALMNPRGYVELELTTIVDGPHLAKALYDFARATVLYREYQLKVALDELEQKFQARQLTASKG